MHSTPEKARATEDQIFDATREPPIKLLKELYEKNQILVLGFNSHNHATHFHVLDSLLREIGHDPRLKRIVLERSIEDAPMLEAASVAPMAPPDLIGRFSSPARARISLCVFPEWAYTWTEFLSRIRTLNAQRPAKNPVLVTSVDAVTLQHVKDVTDVFTLRKYAEGQYREAGTGVNIRNLLWKKLGPSDKAIVVYHIAHMLKTFTVLDDKQERVPYNSMGAFLKYTPEAESRTKIVILDVNFLEDREPLNVLKFTQRQAARSPKQGFGVRMAPFRGVVTEHDTAVFAKDRYKRAQTFGTALSSSATLPDMLDAVIWLPADVTPWEFRRQATYLPVPCGGKGALSQ